MSVLVRMLYQVEQFQSQLHDGNDAEQQHAAKQM